MTHAGMSASLSALAREHSMKKTEMFSLFSFAVGGGVAYGSSWIWPNAHWGVYVVVTLAVV